ncbi:MAG: autotransporter domain-containing protein, partial [Methylococcales bacterium]|nr:autotransporter domain-containing protein [Methylococcales bacterium]
MRSKRREIKTLLPVCACLMTVPYAANLYAQVDNLSPSPVAGALVGDLDVTQTSPEASAGIAIENLCPQLITREQNGQNSVIQADLRARCTDLIVDENQSGSLRQVVAEEVATQETELVELSANQLGQIASRLSALRGGIQSSIQQVSLYEDQAGSIAFQYSGPLFGGAAGDSIGDSGRIGVFINGEVSTGDKDQTVNESGFDVDASSITLGVDYRLSDGGFFGAALGVNQSESDMKNAGGSIDSDGVSVSLYGTKNIQNNSFIDATLGLAKYDYDTARNLNYTANSVSVSQRALASTDADVSFASIGIGHDAQIKQVKGLRATFSGRLNYLDASVDG